MTPNEVKCLTSAGQNTEAESAIQAHEFQPSFFGLMEEKGPSHVTQLARWCIGLELKSCGFKPSSPLTSLTSGFTVSSKEM